jgi:hypothetical protein
MSASALLAIVVLVAGCGAYIFWPQARPAVETEKTRLDYLRERREVIYDNLRDLQFEYRAGKYPEADFLTQREALENEAAAVLAEMDALS